MLVLQRIVNQSIIINHNIKVKVVEVRGNKVRLGVDAPKEIPVHREEVEEAVNRVHGGAPTVLTPRVDVPLQSLTPQIDGQTPNEQGAPL